MYLSRLEIQGFKSFAQKTVFEFPKKSHQNPKAKSLTAIVGPNGAGKSNVADAIRWALGEQSLKLIRCKKAEEVIFGGSASKARQGYAEVSLIFNNEDKELPVDYSEVVISRRVFRDGDTEYRLNKSRVRLFDILIFLAQANFGQKSYSIIGQGLVDQIINISPFERKEFFDEATGVKQYQIKRDQAVNRLRRTRENLLQSNQILQELEPRVRLLNRQMKRLEQKKKVEEELRTLQKQYYGQTWQAWQARKKQFSDQYETKKAGATVWLEKLQTLRQQMSQQAQAESRKDIFNNLQKDHNHLIGQRDELLKELTIIKGKMNLEYVKAGKQNLAWLQDKRGQVSQRLDEIREGLNHQQLKLTEKRDSLAEKEIRKVKLQEKIIQLNQALTQVEKSVADFKVQTQSSRGPWQAIAALLRQKDYIKGLYGPVYELGAIVPQYQKALAAALGIYREAVVVQDLEAALKSLDYLKKNNLGPICLLILNRLKAPRITAAERAGLAEKGVICLAVDQVKGEDKFHKVFQALLGATVVVDNLQSARQGLGREQKMVTLEGDYLDPAGWLKGGSPISEESAINWPPEGRLEDLLQKVERLRAELSENQTEKERLEAEWNDWRVEIQINDTKVKGLKADELNLAKEKAHLEEEVASQNWEPQDAAKQVQQLKRREGELERQLEKLSQTVLAKRQEIDQFNLAEERKRQEMMRCQSQMQETQEKVNILNNELQEIRIEIIRLETKEEDLQNEINQELGGEYKVREEKITSEKNAELLSLDIGKLKKTLDLIGGIEPEVVEEHKEVSERYEFLSGQVLDLEKGIADSEKVVVELDKIINQQFDVSFKKINMAFGHYFLKIFGGGKAKLELTQKELKAEADAGDEPINGEAVQSSLPEEQSPLVNVGIDIRVCPPNKKMDNLASLSGGERTMTALALICAIIDSNPAPFVVLDEVDAALDEANSVKFSSILQELVLKSQFIIITHNRVVMQAADVLYGVTMKLDGVSRVLSLNLVEAEKTVESK